MKLFIQTFLLLIALNSIAQYAPQVGQLGSTAIKKDSTAIVAWANGCILNRGYMNIANTTAGFASAGDESATLGMAGTNGVASLGDGGSAILTFQNAIGNGTGFDFAVFENGFRQAGDSLCFLEYAFVEVSSDGINFFRFASEYVGDQSTQVGSFQTTDTRLYNNLAGKYIANYGTPFDLEELKDVVGLDVNHVTHVKMVDVVGSINTMYAQTDSKGYLINDPWPTEFPTSGFDLDAVGVINVASPSGLADSFRYKPFKLFPNPSTDFIRIDAENNQSFTIELADLSGLILKKWIDYQNQQLDISSVKAGTYLVTMRTTSNLFTQKLIVQ